MVNIIDNSNYKFDNSLRAYFSFLLNSHPTLFCLFFIFFGLTLNTFYNSISSHFGLVWPYSSFMYHPADRFADFFKYILSFPNDNEFKIYNNILIAKEQLLRYQTIEFYNAGQFPDPNNNRQPVYFNPPTATLVALLINKLFTYLDVVGLFVFLFVFFYGMCIFFLNRIYGKFCYFLTFSFLLSYPVIFGFTRGHPFSIVNLILLLGTFYFTLQNKKIWLSIFLLAICINIRPNLLIFLLVFFPLGFRNLLKYSLSTILLSIIILVISYFLVQSIFPMYNFDRFLHSLDWYRNLLVIPGVGHYSSSFLGLIYNFGFTHSLVLEYIIYGLGFFLLILCIAGFLLKFITIDIYLISIFLIYQIVSLNLENYYLLNFWIPLIFLITHLKNNKTTNFNLRKLCTISLLIILIPKEYPSFGINLSQTVNPLCGFICLIVITSNIVYNFFKRNFNLKKVFFDYVKS